MSTLEPMPDMQMRLRAVCLDGDPVVFRGCTMTEFVTLGCGLCTAGTIAGLLALLPFRYATVGAGTGFILGIALTLLAAGWLTRLKRGRPADYHLQIVAVGLHRHGWLRSPFLLDDRAWDTSRTPW